MEVLSLNDKAKQVTHQISDYLNAGVDLVWLIDPKGCNVTVYRRDREPTRLHEMDTLIAEDLLPGFSGPESELFLLPGELPCG